MFNKGHDTVFDLIYASGMRYTFSPNPISFKHRQYTIIVVLFYQNFGCNEKIAEKTEKYSPFIEALKKYWGEM